MKNNLLNIEEVSWDKVRLSVKKVAPDIFEAIEKISPGKKYKLYRATYSYGAMIIGENGDFGLPYNGELLALRDPKVPKELKNELGYNQPSIPMSLILSGQVQLYMEEKNAQVETEGVYTPGVMLAVRGLLDTGLSYHAKRIWQMTAGVRTPVMLPSIADTQSFVKLKRHFNLTCPKPKTQKDQWRLFTEIANHPACDNQWKTELLFFSKDWLLQEEGSWQTFRFALLKRSWKITEYVRNMVSVNRIWESFSSHAWNDRVNIVIFNTVKYIIECCLGQAISYAPENGEDRGGPFEAISKIILDVYGLKKYAPIIMSPYVFKPEDERPAYISLQSIDTYWMNLIHYKPESLIADAREIQYQLTQFIRQIDKGIIQVEGTPFSNIPNFSFNFFHADKDMYQELLPAESIFANDPSVTRWQKNLENSAIASRNSFLRSCIRYELKAKE